MVGQDLDQYRVIEKLGAGGMGVVWKALDIRLGREVALKVLPSEDSGDPASVARFLREARCASALNHPNIVTIYQASSVGDTHFIAMEYVRGQTLAEHVKRGPLAVLKAVDLACQMGQALAHAHAAGIIHRDLKPANVIVTPGGTAKVLDFGLARRTVAAHSTDATLTASTGIGIVAGTLPYMAPEQVAGDNLDARSDIFGFGVVLYEMFTGRRPFQAESRLELVKKILHEEPASPRSLAPEVPEAVESVILRCLRKAPKDRFQAAEDVVSEIREAVGALQAMSYSTTRTQPVPITRNTRKFRVAGAAAFVAVAAIFLVPSVRHAVTSRLWNGGTESGAAATQSGGSAFDDYRAGRSLLDRYDKPGNLNRAFELMQSAIQKNPNDAPAYAGLSEAYVRRNSTAPDPNWISLARDSAKKSVSLDPDLALGHAALGYALSAAGQRSEAATEFQRARELDPKSAEAYVGLAKLAAASGNRAEAETLFQKGIELGTSEWVPSLEYATFLYNNARYEAAIQWCERARRAAPDNTRILTTEAAAYQLANRFEEAASLLQRALTIEPNARTYANLGTLRFFQGNFSDAVGPMEKAVSMQATYYLFWGNLGDAYRWAPGLRSKANGAYSRAIDLIRKSIDASPADAVLRARLAGYLAKSGQPAAALAELKRVEALPNKSGMALFKAGIAYEVAGDRDAALRSVESAIHAGYSMQEVQAEQELADLRSDIRYQKLLARLNGPAKATPKQN